MRTWHKVAAVLAVGALAVAAKAELSAGDAARFADLALSCVEKEYPNKIAHVLSSDEDAGTPRELTPAFYGCYDWHSSVHGHWLLVRVARATNDAALREKLVRTLARNINAANIEQEVQYFEGPGRGSFERPYGLAWLLQLTAELDEASAQPSEHQAQWSAMRAALAPLEKVAVVRFMTWLPKLSHPIRTGEHSQTAFAFGLAYDYAQRARNKNAEFAKLLRETSLAFYAGDVNCPLAFEPSGQDFLSPCLAEADLMRRMLSTDEYTVWLGDFLPGIPTDPDAAAGWLEAATVTDKSDGKLAHLDGLNLSRAWMLRAMAGALREDDPRRAVLLAASKAQADAGLAAVTGEDYAGGHWLGSFATYLVTDRGL